MAELFNNSTLDIRQSALNFGGKQPRGGGILEGKGGRSKSVSGGGQEEKGRGAGFRAYNLEE